MSSSSSAKEIRWGILATGGIATTFTKDLLVDPQTRDVHDVVHTVVAAASSSSASRAEAFLKEVGAASTAKAYGSYKDLVADENVDIIYVATPHSHHYQNTMLCLLAGKNVLCEKAFTVNAAQARKLVETAREKNLFLMEAVWTRYFPLSIYVRDIITSGKIGTVHRVSADLSFSIGPEEAFPDHKHRLVNPDLAGGALLDLGIYALTWCFQTVFLTQPGETKAKAVPSVKAIVTPYKHTGVDEQSTVILNFPRDQEQGGPVHAIATTSMRAGRAGEAAGPTVTVQGTKGEVQVFAPIYRPTRTRLIIDDKEVEDKQWPQPGPGKGSGWFNGFQTSMAPEGEGHGMFWEADEAARALVSGRKNGGRYLDLDESLVIMDVMDEVRKQGGIKYPENIETTDYPVNL